MGGRRMSIENRMMCDYESCNKSVPAMDVMPSGWVYMMTKRVPFGVERECHFCDILHASLHGYNIRDAEEAESNDAE